MPALPPLPNCMILVSLEIGRSATLPNCMILVSLEIGRSATLPNCVILEFENEA